jgi:Sec-independent protein secretion pathway component TatC
MDKIAPYYKAVAGALVSFLTAISTSLVDGTLTAQDWIGAVIALIVGFGAVFTIPNIRSNYPPPEISEPPNV